MHESAGAEPNWVETIAWGLGVYFIGKGIYLGPSLILQRRQAALLAHQAVIAEEAESEAGIP